RAHFSLVGRAPPCLPARPSPRPPANSKLQCALYLRQPDLRHPPAARPETRTVPAQALLPLRHSLCARSESPERAARSGPRLSSTPRIQSPTLFRGSRALSLQLPGAVLLIKR